VKDRVVQGALRNALEPIFEKKFVEHSYGFRPRRSGKDALGRVIELLGRAYIHVVDADITDYFGTIIRPRRYGNTLKKLVSRLNATLRE
jgi:RNA-directed DNA polymerase